MRVQRRASWQIGQWETVASGVTSANYTDTNTPSKQAFYRVLP